MQHPTLRGIYSAALAPKPKNVATVSPVIDDDDEHALEPEDLDGIPGLALQTKSSLRPSSSSSTLRFPFTKPSNQDDSEVSASADKYAVVGQKQQWRRQRSQREKGRATIRHVSEDDLEANREEREELGERASSYLSTGRSEGPMIPSLGASTRSWDSQLSSRESSRFSDSRRSDDVSSQSERELFSVTRQKKSRFAAKLYMPGQNPLYLGRYRSEDAARAACEDAFMTITTPRK